MDLAKHILCPLLHHSCTAGMHIYLQCVQHMNVRREEKESEGTEDKRPEGLSGPKETGGRQMCH